MPKQPQHQLLQLDWLVGTQYCPGYASMVMELYADILKFWDRRDVDYNALRLLIHNSFWN